MVRSKNDRSSPLNILPFDGEASYFNHVLPEDLAIKFFDTLFRTILWKQDEVMIFGKRILTRRKMAWYADDSIPYRYSGITRIALPFTKELLHLKQLTETICGEKFNACLLNYYHDGSEAMGWHSDDEKSIVPCSTIASLSLGNPRKFSFRHKKTRQLISLELVNGSLLVMKGTTQLHWQHSLPKSKKIKGPRINLTFRNMVVSPAG